MSEIIHKSRWIFAGGGRERTDLRRLCAGGGLLAFVLVLWLAHPASAQTAPTPWDGGDDGLRLQKRYFIDEDGEDEPSSEFTMTALDSIYLTEPLRTPDFPQIVGTSAVPQEIPMGFEGKVERRLQLTMDVIQDFFQLRKTFGKKTASIPLFGTKDVLHIDSNVLWYNLLKKGKTRDLAFGPYMTDWHSFGTGSSYSGHYGVHLKWAW